MPEIIKNLEQLILQHPAWTQILIALGILIQGELTLLFAVYLVNRGMLSWPGFVSSTLGVLIITGIIAHFFGRFLRNSRWGWSLDRKIRHNKKIQLYNRYLHQNATRLMIILKFMFIPDSAVLLLTGWSEMKFTKIFKYYLVGISIWFLVLTAAAYSLVSGLNYLNSQKTFERIEFGVGGFIILMFLIEFIIKKLAGRKIEKEAEEAILTEEEQKKLESEEKYQTTTATPIILPVIPSKKIKTKSKKIKSHARFFKKIIADSHANKTQQPQKPPKH